MSFQLGSGHRLYLAYTDETTPHRITALVNADGTTSGSGDDVNALPVDSLKLADQIKDVTVGGTNNTVDVTTRQTARQGFSANIIATSDATMQVQFAYEPRDVLGAYSRLDLGIIQYCFVTKSSIFAIDLDKPIGANPLQLGGQGLGGNYTVGISTPKEVQGQVVIDVEFALESHAQIIYSADGSPTDFRALVDP